MPAISRTPPPAAVEVLRRLLADAGYDEAGICSRLDIPDIYAFQPMSLGRPDRGPPADLLDFLILVFLDAVAVDERVMARFLSPAAAEALVALGLLTRLDDGRCHANAVLYPTRSLYLVSDSPTDPLTGAPRPLASDAVYPAVTEAARHFVTSLPAAPRGRFLEVCAGTGVGALAAAATADHAWAVDITERSTRFAAFNALLNGLDNVTALEGDLYEPVDGQPFDTIVAHPPYMQSDEVREIYRDGGEDGEQVTREILGGLDRHLAPGGRFHCTCMLTDREGVSLEDRIREMLGPARDEFDLLLMPMSFLDPQRSLFDEALRGRATVEETRGREAVYRRLGVRQLVYCSFLLHRRSDERQPLTLRRPRTGATDGAAIEWLLDWELASRTRMRPDDIAVAKPLASPHVRARSEMALADGAWRTVDLALEATWPFPSMVRCAAWVADLIARCDGTRTVADLLAALRREGLLAERAPESGLLELVRSLVSAGILVLPSHPLPPHPEGGSRAV
jgi:SAM-dependent methyltransferase